MRALVYSLIAASVLAQLLRELPRGPLIAGYAPACDANVTRAVESGVNVLYWFAASLLYNSTTGSAYVSYGGPSLDCIAATAASLRKRGLEVAHFLSVGGWDAPHVETATSAAELHAVWRAWNRDVVARPGFAGFDGVDWDLEGNDLPSSPFNFFTAQVLDMVGVFSQLEKEAGYLVSMVPPESYLDPTTAAFDQSLLHDYPDGWQPKFLYHGRNAYAYLLSRYGEARAPGGGRRVPTFDVVLIQLYESYSHLSFNVTQLQQSAADYLDAWVRTVVAGWRVDFGSDANVSWPSADVRVPAERLLVGFANGWAGAAGGKNALVLPSEVGAAHERLRRDGLAPRGYFFWCIATEGQVPAGHTQPLYFAAGLNEFLHVRD